MTTLQAKARGPAFFLVLALITVALAVGFYFGSMASPAADLGSFQQLEAELLTHRGDGGRSCEPKGRYGRLSKAAHCDSEPGRP